MSIQEKLDAAYREMVCARPVGAGDGNTYTVEPPTRERFRKAVLTATGLTEAQLEGLANGTMVVARADPTESMLEAGRRAWKKPRLHVSHAGSDEFMTCGVIYRAMLAAKEG